MKLFIILALAVSAYAAFFTEQEINEHWTNFKRMYGKSYATELEEKARRSIFEQNLLKIFEHNLKADNGMVTFRVGVNQYADLTTEEFTRQMNGFNRHHSNDRHRNHLHHPEVFDVSALPATVDWRTKGVVTPVKNQEQCGSCWAFSAVASIEGQHALKTGKLVSLSEQNLVDCSTAEGNMGCEGGLMDQAFEYVMINKGIDTEKSYPYEAMDDKCRYKKSAEASTVGNYSDIPTGSEMSLQHAVATVGPISVAIDASQFSFQFYTSGVYNEPNCGNQRSDLDHGVTAVGYGVENGKAYWLVKNSWGTAWGEKGYIKMSRNLNNQCGIATLSSYPTMVNN